MESYSICLPVINPLFVSKITVVGGLVWRNPAGTNWRILPSWECFPPSTPIYQWFSACYSWPLAQTRRYLKLEKVCLCAIDWYKSVVNFLVLWGSIAFLCILLYEQTLEIRKQAAGAPQCELHCLGSRPGQASSKSPGEGLARFFPVSTTAGPGVWEPPGFPLMH